MEKTTLQSTILILDDDLAILQLLTDALSKQYRVYTAADILEATDLISTHQFDLIIADLNMPVVSGIELIRHIRAFPRFDHAPILVISAYPDLAERLSSVHVQGFLPKPFSISELELRIQALLHPAKDPRP